MKLYVERQKTIVKPDKKRVIARFFYSGEERSGKLIDRILAMSEKDVNVSMYQILREFSKRHRSLTEIFTRNYEKVESIVKSKVQGKPVTGMRKLLIGSYFTMEYALESAALFNPSIVEDFDQSELNPGEKRYIISFRATGEGHVSSLIFRRAVIDAENCIKMMEPGDQIGEAEIIKNHIYKKRDFRSNMETKNIKQSDFGDFLDRLPEKFNYDQLRETMELIKREKCYCSSVEKERAFNEILRLAESHTEVRFSMDMDLSERVIFPISDFERRGIEDVRFTRFTKENGEKLYYGTYTAFDGNTILPKLIETKDFLNFEIYPLIGKYAVDKNLALFPRKVNNKYVMFSRIDGVNNYIMYSDNLYQWDNKELIAEPSAPWEFIQMGNGGSPIETNKGWLMLTHGVGAVRKYGLGACLLDLDDPSRIIGRLKEPLMIPDEDERSGYVPNVVYTCGAVVHNGTLIIPYAMSDYASSFVTVDLDDLLNEIMKKD